MTGKQLRAWRQKHRLSLVEATWIFGVDAATFNRWLNRGNLFIPGPAARIALMFERVPSIAIDVIEQVEGAKQNAWGDMPTAILTLRARQQHHSTSPRLND